MRGRQWIDENYATPRSEVLKPTNGGVYEIAMTKLNRCDEIRCDMQETGCNKPCSSAGIAGDLCLMSEGRCVKERNECESTVPWIRLREDRHVRAREMLSWMRR